jgi:hypothetical protein
MAGLVPAIHVPGSGQKGVDHRDKPGDDERSRSIGYVESISLPRIAADAGRDHPSANPAPATALRAQ